MKDLRRFCFLLLLLPMAITADAQRQRPKKAKPAKQASPVSKPAPTATIASPQVAEPVIPQEASFKADLKPRKKVVIVPAPPPPPGRDPIPPKR